MVSGVSSGTGAPAPTVNNPTSDLTAHKASADHDGRYYTESEVDGMLNFVSLSDTPAAYTGEGGKIVAVKADVSGLEFVAAPAATNGVPTGGTTNQLAAKNSNTDYDIKWMDAPAAANGIPIGGTVGQMLAKIDGTDFNAQWADASPLTTKGDVFVFGAADARLPVGMDGQVLTADAAQTLGVKWATPSGSASPTGDGTEDTYSGTLAQASNPYNPIFFFIEVLQSFWLEKIKIYLNDGGGDTAIRFRNACGEVLASGSFTISGLGWYTVTLDTPVYVTANGYYCVECKTTTAIRPFRTTNYLYAGTLWNMINDRLNNFFIGSVYSETPGMGLIEYDSTP